MTGPADAYAVARVDQMDCTFEPRPWAFAEARAAEIDAHWAARTAASPKLFNGRVLLLHRGAIVEEDGRPVFRGAYFETEFKAFIAWRDFGFPDRAVRNCFAMAALLAADGGYIVGEMATHTASPGRVYFPAGTPDRQDISAGKVDLAGSALRELAEETGVLATEVTVDPGWILLLEASRVACVQTVRVRDSAADLAARIHAYLAAEPEPELARVHIIRKTADADGLDMPGFMPPFFRAAFAEAQLG